MSDADLLENYRKAYDNRIGFGQKPALVLVDFVQAYFEPTSPLYAGVDEALASALQRVLTDPALRARLSAAGRQRRCERFDSRVTTVSLRDLFLAQLRQARSHIHQGAGALAVVGLGAAARVLDASDLALTLALADEARRRTLHPLQFGVARP